MPELDLSSLEHALAALDRGLKRALPAPASVDGMNHRELFRVGAEQGLVDEPSAWFVYRNMRNITSHTDHAAKAPEVFAVIPAFATHARLLLTRLAAKDARHD